MPGDTPLSTNLPSVQDALKAVHKFGQKANLANIAASVMASHKQNKAASVGSMHHQKLQVPPLPKEPASRSGEVKPGRLFYIFYLIYARGRESKGNLPSTLQVN